MWMSNVYIVVNQNNSDKNSLCDLCAAVCETGATLVGVDEHTHVIEATTPSQEIATIAAMEGVTYVRSVIHVHHKRFAKARRVMAHPKLPMIPPKAAPSGAAHFV